MQDYRSSRVNSREKSSLPSSFFALKSKRAHTHALNRKPNCRQGAHKKFFLFTLQTYDIQIHGQTEKLRGACAGGQGKEAKATISEIGTRADYSNSPGAASEDVYSFCGVCCPLPTNPRPPTLPISICAVCWQQFVAEGNCVNSRSH